MDDALKIIGLAYRAGKALLGEEVYRRFGKIRILVRASDISEKSRERLDKKCHYYGVDAIDCFNAEEISSALGKNNVKVIGITDEGFKKSLLKKIREKEGCHGETDIQETSEQET